MSLNPQNLSNGQEQYETFTALGKKRIQYDYRDHAGNLFSCVAKTLKAARDKRDAWLHKQI